MKFDMARLRSKFSIKYNYIFLFLVFCKALSYWLISWWQHPNDPLSTIVMYRAGGDTQYFPLISALSRLQFGEFCLYEFNGKGIIPFPFVAIVPHALGYYFFGPFGFILTDIVIALVYYIILSRLLELSGASRFLSRCSSLLVATGALNYILSMFSDFIFSRKCIWLTFWGWRIPRPFISEIFFLISIYCILALLSPQNSIARKRYWFILGLSTAFLLQGDLHSALTIIFSIFSLFLFLLFFKKNFRVTIIKGIFSCSFALTIFSIPFFLQRLFENPDVPRRLGLIPIPRTKILLLYGKSTYIALTAVIMFASALLLVVKYFKNIEHKDRIRNSIITMFCICLIAFIIQPVSILLFSKVMQLWQFHDRFIRISLLTIMLFMLYALDSASQFLKINVKGSKTVNFIGSNFFKKLIVIILVFICLSAMFREARISSGEKRHIRYGFVEYGSLPNYRDDFVLLIKELIKREYKDCKVIGTFDHLVFSWWVTFNHGFSYLVDPFIAAVPDSTIELRLINLCKIIGMSSEEFKNFFTRPYVYTLWLGHAKYQANSLYAFSPLSDYDADTQKTLKTTNIDAIWHQIIPKSEQIRLIKRYLNDGTKNDLRLDLVVLTNDESLSSFAPSSHTFMLTYKNSTFRVWRRKDCY